MLDCLQKNNGTPYIVIYQSKFYQLKLLSFTLPMRNFHVLEHPRVSLSSLMQFMLELPQMQVNLLENNPIFQDKLSYQSQQLMLMQNNSQQPHPSEEHNKITHKLNWTKVLYDHNIFVDSQLYKKWDHKYQMPNQHILQQDLTRTRANDPYFKKQSTKEVLRRIATVFCQNNSITYQQGMLEVIVPFALLHRKNFQLCKCYAYFNSFMRRHFPKVLIQRHINNKVQLPHTFLALSLAKTLLRFHYPLIFHYFKQNQGIENMILTQEIMTVGAKNLSIQHVYKVYDYYINKKNKNSLLYLAVALIGLYEKKIIQAAKQEMLYQYCKNMKQISTQQHVIQWLKLADKIQEETPPSFEKFSKNLGFTNHSVLTHEDFLVMMKIEEVLKKKDFIMPVYLKDILQKSDNYVFVSTQAINLRKVKKFKLKNIDDAKNQPILLNNSVVLTQTENCSQQQKDRLKALAQKLQWQNNHILYLQEQLASELGCIIY